MNEQAETRPRMDVAKEVNRLNPEFGDRPDLEIGLRVYGARNNAIR